MGGESFSEPQPGIALLEVRSVQTGFAVPTRVGRRRFSRFVALVVKEKSKTYFAPLDFIEKINGSFSRESISVPACFYRERQRQREI